MSQVEWYRRTSWTANDKQDFYGRLSRCRLHGKEEYRRIQAVHLAEAGLHLEAIALFDELLSIFPNTFWLSTIHHHKATSLEELGRFEESIAEYKISIDAERKSQNATSHAWLDFGWLIVTRQFTDHYDEVETVMNEFRRKGTLMFPVLEYMFAAIQAVLAEARSDVLEAKKYAQQAILECNKTSSGLRYYASLGLVSGQYLQMRAKLEKLAEG